MASSTSDRWSTRGGDYKPDAGQLQKVAEGWVNDFHLVVGARGLVETVPLVFREATVEFGTPVLSGRLVKLPSGKFRLTEAVLAGRVGLTDMLDLLGSKPFDQSLSPTGRACDSPLFETFLKPLVCPLADTLVPSSNDFANQPCNAMSVAFRFEAEPVELGNESYNLSGAVTRCTKNPAKRCN